MANPVQVVVVGGGAAGFFAAIACATTYPDTQIILLEAAATPLGKVRISGGGRCNVTHQCFDPALLVQNYPRGGKALRGAFARFQPQDTIAWYQARGVRLKAESDGRMFPTTDTSETIIDCLQGECRRTGITTRTKTAVTAADRIDNRFRVKLRSGDSLSCDRLLLATGSSPQGHRMAKALGHTIAPPVPSLFTFSVPDSSLHQLAGVAVEQVTAKLSVAGGKPLTQTGPVLITHWGFSGPTILKLSAWGARILHASRYQGTLHINWLPEINEADLRQRLHTTKQQVAKRAIANHCPVDLPKRLWRYWVQRVGLEETTWANLSKKALSRLVESISRDTYSVQGKGVFKDEFVTCGGVQLTEVNFKTMESRLCPGLFFAGEILDIDGITGGFNFQSAWTTGWLAGQALGQPNSDKRSQAKKLMQKS